MKEYLLDNGYSFMLTNCDRPSYLFPAVSSKSQDSLSLTTKKVQVIEISSPQLKFALKKVGRCENNVWRRAGPNAGDKKYAQLNYLTYDLKGEGIGYSPSLDLIRIMRLKGLCDEYMKFFYHPGYFLSGIKRPTECDGGRVDKDEEARIDRVRKNQRRKSSLSSSRHFID